MDDERLVRRRTAASLAFALLMVVPSLARATTLVVLAGDDFLVLAAGSLPTIAGSRGTDRECKIHRAGDVFLGISDVPALGGEVTKVIVEELRYGRGTAEERVVHASQAAQAFLLESIGQQLRSDLRRAHGEIFDLQHGMVVDAFAATMLEGRPALWQLELRMIYDGAYVSVVPKTNRIRPAANDRLWFDAFHNGGLIDVAVQRFEARAAVDRNELIAGARDLVQRDLDLEAKKVRLLPSLRPSIAVALISAAGAQLVVPGPCGSAWAEER
jgi:hypothetical protein